MKKKNGIAVIVTLLLLSLSMIGCGKDKAVTEQKQDKPAVTEQKLKPLTITMAAGSAGGASQAIGEAIGETIKKTAPGTSFTYQPSKFGANASLVGEEKVELGMELGEFVSWTKEGTEIFKKAYPNLNVIAFLHNDAYSMQIQKDTGITSFDQIKKQKFPLKISVNTKNGGLEYPNRWVFDEYGFNYNDVNAWGGNVNFSSSGEAGNLFKDRKLNALAWTAQQPMSIFYDYYKAVPVNWLEPSAEVVDKIIKSHKSLIPYTIPAKMYADYGLTKDYKTFSMPMFLVSSSKMSDETAYTIAKAIYNNFDYLHQTSAVLGDLDKNSIVPKIAGVPIHPGAEKFYREVGLIK